LFARAGLNNIFIHRKNPVIPVVWSSSSAAREAAKTRFAVGSWITILGQISVSKPVAETMVFKRIT
jgi:hypothetical protein